MTRTPLVSAILIFLNAEAFLEEAIKSVLAQTWNDWELLLVDDGSTDGSTSIARGYAEEHGERIIYLEHHAHMNRGKSTSRNLGFQRARGEYVAFLDADDVWLPAKLAKQADRLSGYPEAVMLYGPTQYWRSWAGGSRGRDFRGVVGVRADTLHRGPYLLSCYLARPGIVPGICSVMTRRKAVVEVAGFEESIQQMFEDQTLIAKLCLHGSV
jgi:glycosyltransferase involved in cell wall biosynthesis